MTSLNSLHNFFAIIFATLFACATIQTMDKKTGTQPVDDLYYFRTAGNNDVLATPLDQAAFYNRLDVLKRLLAMKADPNLVNQPTGLPPLTTAINQGSIAAAHTLISAGAYANASDAHGGSPLLAAAEKGDATLVNRLLLLKADVEKKTYAFHKRVTALMQSAQNGHTAVVNLLIAAQATVNTPDIERLTALHKAVLNGHSGVIETLLAAGANPHKRDAYGKRPIDYATSDEIRELLRNIQLSTKTPADDSSPANYPTTQSMQKLTQESAVGEPKNIEQLNKNLIRAAQDGCRGELASFLSQGGDVNGIFTQQAGTHIEQTTALCQAVQYNQLKELNFLLKRGAQAQRSQTHQWYNSFICSCL